MKYEIEKTFCNSKSFKTIRLSYVLSDHDKFFDKNTKAEVFDGLFRSVVRLETVLESVYCLINNFNFNDYYLVNISGNKCISRKDLAEYYKKKIANMADIVQQESKINENAELEFVVKAQDDETVDIWMKKLHEILQRR